MNRAVIVALIVGAATASAIYLWHSLVDSDPKN